MEKTYVFTDLSARTAARSAGTLFTRGLLIGSQCSAFQMVTGRVVRGRVLEGQTTEVLPRQRALKGVPHLGCGVFLLNRFLEQWLDLFQALCELNVRFDLFFLVDPFVV